MKYEKLQRIFSHFDCAALLAMKKLTNEEWTILAEYYNSLGARGAVPAARSQKG